MRRRILLQHGVALLEQLARASQEQGASSSPSRLPGSLEVVRDAEQSPYLKIPLPKPEAMNQALAALQNLAASLK